MTYNIYCDESCHLEHDSQKYMVIGGIIIPKSERKRIISRINSLKECFEIGKNVELKWKKVSMNKIEFYERLIDLFFEEECMRFRAIIIDKTKINHAAFNQTHDEWYYKMYFELLQNLIEPKCCNNVYVDIKDTRSYEKTEKLGVYLNRKFRPYESEPIKQIKEINSMESPILQLADILIGAIGYLNREMNEEEKTLNAKGKLVKFLQSKSKYSLRNTTLLSEKKVNLFYINLNNGESIV